MKAKYVILFILAAAAVIQPATLQAEERLMVGEATIQDAAPIRVRSNRGGDLQLVPVTVDLTGVFLNGHNPVLGGYIARIEFDPSVVSYVRADGGASAFFTQVPYATNAEKANAEGVLRLAASHADANAPSGLVNVARLTFRELRRGGASTIKVRLDSLASALERDANGEFIKDLSIPVAEALR